MKTLIFFIFILTISYSSLLGQQAVDISSIKLHTDFPYINTNNKLKQDIFYSSNDNIQGEVQIRCYKMSLKDSLLIYSKKNIKVSSKAGAGVWKINLDDKDTDSYCNTIFREILKSAEVIPAGEYKYCIVFSDKDKSEQFVFVQNIDSNFSKNTPIYKEVNACLLKKTRSFLGMKFLNSTATIPNISTLTLLNNNKRKLEAIAKSRALEQVTRQGNNCTHIEYYYKGWFVGRYDIKNRVSIVRHIDNPVASLKDETNIPVTNDLENHTSLLSQFRELKKDQRDEKKIDGELSILTNASTGQELYSAVDNNYTEVRGQIELPVVGLPVDIEGLYTTQDAHRQAKSSYINIHYDVNKSKDELTKLIAQYKGKYNETVSKGDGLNNVYGSALTNLQTEKTSLSAQLTKGMNVPDAQSPGINIEELKGKALASALNNSDTLADKKKIQDSINKVYGDYQAKYNRLLALEQKINKYQLLLNQYKNTNYFDSALAYSKLQHLQNTDQMSYKDMAKKADNILPEGKSKNFLSGITNVDLGTFPKYESKYTMPGQMMKGASLGYDLGFCQTAITVGKTQFIGADGSVDQYTSYSAKITVKPYKDERLSLIYFGYSPSKQMLSDVFYKNVDISAPSFTSPVHIISLNYDATLQKYVTLHGEAATSINAADTLGFHGGNNSERMAYDLSVEGHIPNSTIDIDGAYSKAGRDFQNNTLAISPAGSQQYTLGAKGDFFRSFLTLKISYNYMFQSSFATDGGNRRWGFDLITHSKKYPCLSFSYKPFSTFRSYSDTLTIPQRPIIGSVTTLKASYQIKRAGGKSWRFTTLYNSNNSIADTLKYGSRMMQASCIYAEKQFMISAALSNMRLTGANADSFNTMPNNTNLLDLAGAYSLTQNISVSGSQDIGSAGFGLCKYMATVGCTYRFNKLPLMARINLRYNTYQLNNMAEWQKLYSGSIELNWRFSCTKEHKTL